MEMKEDCRIVDTLFRISTCYTIMIMIAHERETGPVLISVILKSSARGVQPALAAGAGTALRPALSLTKDILPQPIIPRIKVK